MRDLKSPLLVPQVVAELVRLSPQTLRRWDALVLGRPDARTGRGGDSSRLYSWKDVELLQQAADLVRRRRVPLAEVRAHLARRPRPARARAWIVDRPKPARRPDLVETGPGGRGAIVPLRRSRNLLRRTRSRRRSVVVVGLPRSAGRRER